MSINTRRIVAGDYKLRVFSILIYDQNSIG